MKSFYLILVPIFILSFETKAQTILIPDQTVAAQDYVAKCQQPGYTCVQKYLIDQTVEKPSVLFDALIDSIDVSNKLFIDTLPKQVQNILQSEMISFEQLEMLIRLLEQSQDGAKDLKTTSQLISELKYIQSASTSVNAPNFSSEDVVVFFKRPYSHENFQKLKKSYLNLPYVEIRFASAPNLNFTKSKVQNTANSLVTGTCENAVISPVITTTQWKILSEKSCGWSETLNKSSSGFTTTIKENKGWILTGALIIGAALLTKQYEVSF